MIDLIDILRIINLINVMILWSVFCVIIGYVFGFILEVKVDKINKIFDMKEKIDELDYMYNKIFDMKEKIDELDYMYNRLYIMSGECLKIQGKKNETYKIL